MPRDWDAASYDRVARGVQAMGLALLDRLELRGDETVLDAGCGSGAVTRVLAERLPAGRVIAVDASSSMVERAALALGDRAEVRQADLTELVLEEPVDIVFSSATFHWIADHDRLYGRLFAALRPGGRLLCQYGAAGNAAEVRAAAEAVASEPRFAPHLGAWPGPWNFQAPETARATLLEAGFEEVDARVHRVTVVPEEPEEFLRTVALGHHLERLPDALRESYAEAVAARLDDPLTVEYVRLTVAAHRPPGGGDSAP